MLTCLRKDPERRYQSAHDLIRALEHARGMQSSGVVLPVSFAGERRPFGTPIWWWQFHQLATCGVYAVVVVLLSLARSHRPAPRMPAGHAALLWLHQNMPRAAEKVLSAMRAEFSKAG